MTMNHKGNVQPSIDNEEHTHIGGNGAKKVFDIVSNSLAPAVYDYIALSYTGSNLTGVVYKTGGASGTVVSTLTLGYDPSNNLTSVTKS